MLSMLPCEIMATTKPTSSKDLTFLHHPLIAWIRITIVSDAFKGKMPVARHRMVYALLDDEFKNGLHAVNIITKTPEEFNKSKET